MDIPGKPGGKPQAPSPGRPIQPAAAPAGSAAPAGGGPVTFGTSGPVLPGSQAPRPDFEQLLYALQRRHLEGGKVQAVELPSARYKPEGRFMLLWPQGENPAAVALARVERIARSPMPRPLSNEPPSPLSTRVLAGIYEHGASLLYVLFGWGADIKVYVGVKADAASPEDAALRASSAFESLKTCLAATYPDIRLRDLEWPRKADAADGYQYLLDKFGEMKTAVSLVGNPSPDETGQWMECNIDRLVRALTGSHYAYVVEAQPVGAANVAAAFEAVTRQVAEAHKHVKWTATSSVTTYAGESREHLDRFALQYEELLEVACRKLDAGLREGMWRTSVTLLAPTPAEAERAGSLLRAVFAGKESKPEPVKALFHTNPAPAVAALKSLRSPRAPGAAPDAIGLGCDMVATALCSSEVGLFVDLPRKEAPGYRVTRPREFALDIESGGQRQVNVGTVFGPAGLTNTEFAIDVDDLTRHVLVVGVTGSGKTNTALYLLDQIWGKYGIPFLVIEPAKAQYRNLLASSRFKQDLQIFAPGLRRVAPFRLNPFEFETGVDAHAGATEPGRSIDPQAHISNLYAVFNAAFILYAPMPYVLERSLYDVYEERGWDIAASRHPDADPRTGEVPALAFPTLDDLHRKIGEVVNRLGYEEKIRMDVTAGLQARVDSLRVGQKGSTFNCRKSVPFAALLEKPTILEVSHIGSDEEKAFLIGLVLMRLYEARELRGESPGIKHLTLVEEAHRLLSKTSTDTSSAEVANVKGKAVETFCNILAEIRAYGEGIIIAEQIPAKLASDVLKNTNLKILHRIVAQDDRELMGGAMNLVSHQQAAVASLARGEAAVYAEGMESPALVRVPLFKHTGEEADTLAPVSTRAAKRPQQVSDESVGKQSAAFYQKHPGILGQMAGCPWCRDVCRYKSRAVSAVSGRAPAASVWGYAVSCFHDSQAAVKAWPELAKKLVPEKLGKQLAAQELDDLTWCAFNVAAENAVWSFRQAARVSCRDLEALLGCLAPLAQAGRSRAGADLVQLHSSYRAKATRVLRVDRGPNRGCVKCRYPCLYGPLGAWLGRRKDMVGRLHASLGSKDVRKSLAAACRKAAAAALFTNNVEALEGVAVCLYANFADFIRTRDPVGDIEFLFGK